MIADTGDIYLAAVHDEQRRRVLVMSSPRFHALSGRAVIAPAGSAQPFPWRIAHDTDVFAIDLLQTIATDRLLDRLGHVPEPVLRTARQALRLIT